MAITKTDIVNQFGDYYIKGGQNEKRLISGLFQGREFPTICTPMPTDETLFRLSNPAFRSLVQAFQKGFTQKGEVEFVPNEIRVFHIKIDDEFYPDELIPTWLGFLASMEEPERKNWPFVRWMAENYYKKQIDQDMELNEYYKGAYVAPTTNVAGLDGKSMDGLKKQLQTGVDAGTINVLDIPALDKDTIFDTIELAIEKISEVYQGIPMDVCVSRYWYRKYMQDKRSQGFYQKTSDTQIDAGIDFSPQSVKPLAAMVGTDDLFITPKANLLHLHSLSATKKNFKIEEAKRAVAVMADWHEGVGFAYNKAVWTNIKPTGSGSV
jgi:hypothetical protein